MPLPPLLLSSLSSATGFSKDAFEAVHTSGEQITSIRMNPMKPVKKDSVWVNKVDGEEKQPEMTPIPWSTQGYYLSHRPSFTFDPLFQAGAYYVQEASSMFLELAVRQTMDVSQSIRVLDACAAPGGKSTLLQSVISADSLLVSNEVIKSRAAILCENITKWGAANVVVTNSDPRELGRLENYFDLIVVDAPCSGSGLFRRDPEAVVEWSEGAVELCSQRQQRILADLYPSLKEDGVLIYSTCSYSEAEDEEIIDWLMETYSLESVSLDIKEDWGIITTSSPIKKGTGYRFWPDKVKGEGFFISCFRKKEGGERNARPFKKNKEQQLPKAEMELLQPLMTNFNNLSFFRQEDRVFAIPASLEQDILFLINSSVYIRQAGISLGKAGGKEWVPEHALALSNYCSPTVVVVSLNQEQAIQYLRREEVPLDWIREQLPAGFKQGWSLVQFEGTSLGWIKILPNRVNNYYPKEWRILNKPGN